jgi:glutamine amidotransferase
VISSGCVLAAVRSATVGMPLEESAAAPFTDGRWLLSHNGRLDRTVLPPRADAESTVDSALLAAMVFSQGPGNLGRTVLDVAALDPAARLNLLATDGTRLLATTWGDTLSVLTTAEGTALASEPWDDDPAWTDVPDRHLVEVTPDGVRLTRLTEEQPA